MRSNTLLGQLFLLFSITCVTARKNVLFIMSDDMRPEAEPFRNNWGFSVAPDDLHTPNLEELAANGTTFQKAFCQVALCGPSRTSIMTSRRPETTGVLTNAPYWRDYTYDFTSLPQHFKNNGYTSVGLGKIYHNDYDGVNGGYDYPSWSFEDGYEFYPPSTQSFWKAQNKNSHLAVDENDYRKDLMDRDVTDKAKEWISDLAGAGNNFFMAVGFKLPHLPWVAPEEFFDNFTGDVSVPDNMYVPNDLPSSAFFDSAELRAYDDMSNISSWTGEMDEALDDAKTIELRKAYYASVSYIDSLLGELTSALKSHGLYDDTIIVFTSDHGYHLGEHNIWTKNTNFEVAVQVPLIISAPGYRSGARTTTKLVELVDLFPTLAELAGLSPIDLCGETTSNTTELCTEGASLVPLLSSDTEASWDKGAVFHQYARGQKMGLSIRTHDYRYTVWLKCDPTTKAWDWSSRVFGYELYDLRTDTYENTNLAYVDGYETLMNSLHVKLVEGWREQRPS